MTSEFRILVEMRHGIGDVVHTLPLLKNLKVSFPKGKIDVIAGGDVQAELFLTSGFVNSCYVLRRPFFSITNFNTILKLRRKRYSFGFASHLSNQLLSGILLFLIRIRFRIGEGSENFWLLKFLFTHLIKRNDSINRIHRNLNMLEAVGIEPSLVSVVYELPSRIQFAAKSKLPDVFQKKNELIAICIGTNPILNKSTMKSRNLDYKRWPIESWLSLIEQLPCNYRFVLLGSIKEQHEIQPYLGRIHGNERILNLIAKTSFLESLGVIKYSRLVVAADTGLLHFASALGTETVGIFGPSDPKLVGPLVRGFHPVTLNLGCQFCYGTNSLGDCRSNICITNITVEMILDVVLRVLGEDKHNTDCY